MVAAMNILLNGVKDNETKQCFIQFSSTLFCHISNFDFSMDFPMIVFEFCLYKLFTCNINFDAHLVKFDVRQGFLSGHCGLAAMIVSM